MFLVSPKHKGIKQTKVKEEENEIKHNHYGWMVKINEYFLTFNISLF